MLCVQKKAASGAASLSLRPDFCLSICKDGKLRAFDAETGKVLWVADLPTGTKGIPAMYEVDGRKYRVVAASTPLIFGLGPNGGHTVSSTYRGYITYALPQ